MSQLLQYVFNVTSTAIKVPGQLPGHAPASGPFGPAFMSCSYPSSIKKSEVLICELYPSCILRSCNKLFLLLLLTYLLITAAHLFITAAHLFLTPADIYVKLRVVSLFFYLFFCHKELRLICAAVQWQLDSIWHNLAPSCTITQS